MQPKQTTNAATLAQSAQEKVKPEIAHIVSNLRRSTGGTRTEFAQFVCLEENVIKALEESSYPGNAFLMLVRIVKFLGKDLRIRIVPLEGKPGTEKKKEIQ